MLEELLCEGGGGGESGPVMVEGKLIYQLHISKKLAFLPLEFSDVVHSAPHLFDVVLQFPLPLPLIVPFCLIHVTFQVVLCQLELFPLTNLERFPFLI